LIWRIDAGGKVLTGIARRVFGLPLFLAILFGGESVAQNRIDVSMELVLAIDASASVDDREYHLQLGGISQALRTQEIIDTILQYSDGVAVSVIHWGGWADSVLDPPWRLLKTDRDIRALADELDEIERRGVGHLTALGHAIEVAVELIDTNIYRGRQRKIDVSGDGRNNSGRAPDLSRQFAFAKGITINGLVILSDDAGLYDYYDANVIVGPSRFLMQIDSYDDYAVAITRKMKRELAPPIAFGPLSTDVSGPRKATVD